MGADFRVVMSQCVQEILTSLSCPTMPIATVILEILIHQLIKEIHILLPNQISNQAKSIQENDMKKDANFSTFCMDLLGQIGESMRAYTLTYRNETLPENSEEFQRFIEYIKPSVASKCLDWMMIEKKRNQSTPIRNSNSAKKEADTHKMKTRKNSHVTEDIAPNIINKDSDEYGMGFEYELTKLDLLTDIDVLVLNAVADMNSSFLHAKVDASSGSKNLQSIFAKQILACALPDSKAIVSACNVSTDIIRYFFHWKYYLAYTHQFCEGALEMLTLKIKIITFYFASSTIYSIIVSILQNLCTVSPYRTSSYRHLFWVSIQKWLLNFKKMVRHPLIPAAPR
jgi:hypothetical protein